MDEKPYGVIYCITNKVNGKIYIGQTTKTIEKRLKGHFYESKCSDYYIHRAINKYGINNFYIKQIDFSFTKEYLNELEKYYIDFFVLLFQK